MASTLFSDFQPLAAFTVTPQSLQILRPLCQATGASLHLPDSLEACEDDIRYQSSLREYLPQVWSEASGLIFCLATGAVVRLIAPLLQSKDKDPAVVVMDPQGQFVISLCGGHQGGADRLAQGLADWLGARAILTGAAQALQMPAIDTLGQPWGWRRGAGDWTAVSAVLARQESVLVEQNSGSTLWQRALPADHAFQWQSPAEEVQARLWISAHLAPASEIPLVQWHPRVLWLGLGCVRGTSVQLIRQAIQATLTQYQLAPLALAGIASLDLKADEVGLLDYCQSQGLALHTFTPEQLNTIPVPNPSPIVAQEVGTASVAEAAALAAAQADGPAKLLVPKQIFKDGPEAVTIAIAEAEQELIGRDGALWLIGTGPGDLAQITPAARTAIRQADVLIGYSLYLDLIQPLQRPGQIVEAFPITQERQRCQRAVALAQWGLKVAMVSSGDCGIYGMAGLALEELQKQNWDGQTLVVEVFPGITALQAAAARVGAPLMHDFCAISLSDLLTPREKILQRLQAAAQADFVTALYNPQSQKRRELIVQAQTIFLQHRSPDTPVALVRSAYRADEQIIKTTLATLLEHSIDMLTVVLIGNCSTYPFQGWLITPRGY
ncbi:precorrin-3B C(17)-methyltransferase [Synechocystis sp. LKSZ1]|uniref:precorrin-3B C(17)-methyltransferase n=1 Tax=Synechocystis sp. LKSZ1 TaxID=3144951 RepID=UPI00336BAF76